MVKYLQLTLVRADNVNACTATRSRTRVYARVSYKNIIYTTTRVSDMGQSPEFAKDGTHVCHFEYENEADFITVELFNWNNNSIGKSKLSFSELAKLRPKLAPEEKILPVMSVTIRGYQKQYGELILTAQMKHQQAVGELGNLILEVKQGNIKGLTSIFARTTKMQVKLSYKYTKLTSGFLKGMGDIFIWRRDNTFSFIINSSNPDDVVEIEVFNGSNKVGECKIQTVSLIPVDEDPASPAITRTADLLVKNKNVGSIEVAATFSKCLIGRRNSYPQDRAPTQSTYSQHPNPSIPVRHAHHNSQPLPQAYSGSYTFDGSSPSTSSSLPHSPPHAFYPPPHRPHTHPVQSRHNPAPQSAYEPSAPPASMYPPANPSARGHPRAPTEAHGAPPVDEERNAQFEGYPEIKTFVDLYI